MKLDKEIYQKILDRDEDGLRLLYQNFSDSLYGIAYRILKNQSYAEDVIQKSFLKIWKNIGQYDSSKSTLFTWMAAIVRNNSIDIKRLKSFQNEQTSESIDALVNSKSKMEIDTNAMDVAILVKGMDEKYSFVIEYLYLRGYSQSELSDEFDIPLGTIKTRVKKGIDILRSKVEKEKGLFLGLFIIILILIFV